MSLPQLSDALVLLLCLLRTSNEMLASIGDMHRDLGFA